MSFCVLSHQCWGLGWHSPSLVPAQQLHHWRRWPEPGRTPQFNTFLALHSFSLCQHSAALNFPFKTFENLNDIYKISLVTFVGLTVTAQTPFQAFPVS